MGSVVLGVTGNLLTPGVPELDAGQLQQVIGVLKEFANNLPT